MSSADDVRGLALALPEVEEYTHFRLPSLRVRGNVFAVLQAHAVLHLYAEATRAATSDHREGVEEARHGDRLVGVRVTLSRPADALQED